MTRPLVGSDSSAARTGSSSTKKVSSRAPTIGWGGAVVERGAGDRDRWAGQGNQL
ncbi:MAG: hypothetical protein ACRDTA_09690 [Pseudonocardiaceae bacterium]